MTRPTCSGAKKTRRWGRQWGRKQTPRQWVPRHSSHPRRVTGRGSAGIGRLVSQSGGVENLSRGLVILRKLSDTSAELDSESRLQELDRTAQAFMSFCRFTMEGSGACRSLSTLCATSSCHVSNLEVVWGRSRISRYVDKLVCIAAKAAPVYVNGCGHTNLTATFAFSIHNSGIPNTRGIIN